MSKRSENNILLEYIVIYRACDKTLIVIRVPQQSNALKKQIKKFFHLYYGPYRISKCFNDNAYELVNKDKETEILGHYNRCDLKLYKKLVTSNKSKG